MKMKKLLALVLSAVMAVSMLAACGGGGATNILNRSEVEQIIYDAGVDIDVGSSSEVTRAIRYGAELIKERNYSSLSVSYLSNQLRDYIPADAYFNTAFTVSNAVSIGTLFSVAHLLIKVPSVSWSIESIFLVLIT